jgi:23S rRNA pseudoU1915 N3-methylase RlmH
MTDNQNDQIEVDDLIEDIDDKINNNLKENNDVSNALTNPNEKVQIKDENKKDNNNLENNDNNEENNIINKSDSTKIINNYTNKFDNEKKIFNSDNNAKYFNRNAKSKSDLKIIVNTSSNIKGADNTNKRIKTFDLSKSVKTPNNFFKTKLITNYKALKNRQPIDESNKAKLEVAMKMVNTLLNAMNNSEAAPLVVYKHPRFTTRTKS